MAVPPVTQGSKSEREKPKFIPWEVFHMSVAALESQKSNCSHSDQVGACIVSPIKKIVAVGHSSLEKEKTEDCKELLKDVISNFVSHAAINAILNKDAESVVGCTMYITKCPSNEEAKAIIQAGITEVIYLQEGTEGSPIYKYDRAKQLLISAKVWFTWYGDMPIQSFGIEHAHPNLKLDVFPLPGQPTKQPQASPSESDKDKDHFMAMACLASLRSKDTRKKVGACLVDKDGKIVGLGYNGFPINVSDHDPRTTWKSAREASAQDDRDGTDPEFNKHLFVVHAELNVIMYKNCVDLRECTLFTTLFPCLECAKVIIRSGIKKVYYLTDYLNRGESKVKWNSPAFEKDWRKNRDKETYVASRCLLKDHFKNGTETNPSDRIIEQHIPSEKFCIDL